MGIPGAITLVLCKRRCQLWGCLERSMAPAWFPSFYPPTPCRNPHTGSSWRSPVHRGVRFNAMYSSNAGRIIALNSSEDLSDRRKMWRFPPISLGFRGGQIKEPFCPTIGSAALDGSNLHLVRVRGFPSSWKRGSTARVDLMRRG